jgi:hypothetical protein
LTRLAAAGVLALLAFAPVAGAAPGGGGPYDAQGRLVRQIPFTPPGPVR